MFNKNWTFWGFMQPNSNPGHGFRWYIFLTKKYTLHNLEGFYTELYSQMDKDA